MARLRSKPALVKSSKPQWIVTSDEQGLRLDRFLAAPERLGSRGRVRVALERGQVFLNDAEASNRDAGTRLKSGDLVRLWIDRPGSARLRRVAASAGQGRKKLRPSILFLGEKPLIVEKTAGPPP